MAYTGCQVRGNIRYKEEGTRVLWKLVGFCWVRAGTPGGGFFQLCWWRWLWYATWQ